MILRTSSLIAVLGLSVCLLGLGGCQFQRHQEELGRMHAAGRYDLALKDLDSPESQKLYGPQDRLVYVLDRGALLLAERRDQEAIASLEEAESIMEYQGPRDLSDRAAEWLINDTAAKYVGEPYEDQYTNVMKLLAQLRSGQISGGATVEARRAANKADELRSRYAVSSAALRQKDAAATEQGAKYGDSATAGQFIESPLGTYLTAVTFMKSGDRDLQAVAGRRLTDSIQLQRQFIGPVNPASFSSLGELRPDSANVLLVAFSGRGPVKIAERVGPIPFGDWPIYFELPVLRADPSRVARVRATLTPENPTETNPPQLVEMNLVESLSGVAIENHRRQLPVIYTRTLIRATVRSGISFAATQVVRHGQGGGRRAQGEAIVSVLAGLASIALLERADLRCWTFLPGQAHVALAKLPAGPFSTKIEYLSASGQVIHTDNQPATPAGEAPTSLSTVIAHFWN